MSRSVVGRAHMGTVWVDGWDGPPQTNSLQDESVGGCGLPVQVHHCSHHGITVAHTELPIHVPTCGQEKQLQLGDGLWPEESSGASVLQHQDCTARWGLLKKGLVESLRIGCSRCGRPQTSGPQACLLCLRCQAGRAPWRPPLTCYWLFHIENQGSGCVTPSSVTPCGCVELHHKGLTAGLVPKRCLCPKPQGRALGGN